MNRTDLVLATCIAIGLGFVLLRLRAEPDGELRIAPASIRVVDGDTMVADGTRLRLTGMDAPELAQTCERGAATWPCGREARDELRALTHGQTIECRSVGRDRYARMLARCRTASGDLGGLMVARGLAIAYGDYRGEERTARARGLGLWAGTFERPDAWRRLHPRSAAGLTETGEGDGDAR